MSYSPSQESTTDVAGGGDVDDQCGSSGLVVVPAQRERCGATSVGSVPVCDRLRRLRTRLRRDPLEQDVTLRHHVVEPPSLAADGANAAHGLVHHLLLIDATRIIHGHGDDGLLALLLIDDLALHDRCCSRS